MPEDGVPLLPKDNLLTTDEVERVAKLFVENGVRKIRLTGGEPTVRKDLVDVVGEYRSRKIVLCKLSTNLLVHSLGTARLSALEPRIDSLGLTSNGVTLRRHLPSLVEAGLTHLNISLDTLDEHKYELMTRRRAFNKVVETLEVAKRLRDEKGLKVKINCVVIKGEKFNPLYRVKQSLILGRNRPQRYGSTRLHRIREERGHHDQVYRIHAFRKEPLVNLKISSLRLPSLARLGTLL